MSATVRIPTILRTFTSGAGEVTAEGSTLREVLDNLEASFLGIRARIVDEQGALRRFVNVYVGDDDVRFIGGLDAEIADGAADLDHPGGRGGLTSATGIVCRSVSRRTIHSGTASAGPGRTSREATRPATVSSRRT